MNDLPPLLGGPLVAALALALVALAVAAIKRLLHVCEPNEVLIFSGRNRTTEDGRKVGYRVVFGGRAYRWPILERVDRMDLSLLSVPMAIRGAYSEGGIPLPLHAVANVKIASDPRLIGNAIERFLGHPRAEIARVAKETLEGHLRGVIATMTPEEVNEDRLKFAERLSEEAGADLRKLGLQLDVLKIQAVSDDRNYLDSIGRERLAEILRLAEVAESDAIRTAEKAESDGEARGGVALRNAHALVQREQNRLRQIKAELWAKVRSEEERAEQAAQAARAEAERELQTLRAEVERLRLAADVTIPAEAERRARTLLAAGESAAISENGKAMGDALRIVGEAWKECGERAMDLVVLQQLDTIFDQVTEAARRAQPEKVSLLDGGDGSTIAAYVSAYPATVGALLSQLEETLGVDVRRVLRGEPTPPRDTTPPLPGATSDREAA
ncbi:MAG: flotillin [Myxococcales bacterium]|nr:flotillin [Myxococcales bacterium]